MGYPQSKNPKGRHVQTHGTHFMGEVCGKPAKQGKHSQVQSSASSAVTNGHHIEVISYSRSNRVERLFNLQEVLFELSIMVVVVGCFGLVVMGKTLLKRNIDGVYL